MDQESRDYIANRYQRAQAENDTAATTAILGYVADHDRANPDEKPLMNHLDPATDKA
jgi:hypothetical protein